MDKPFVKQGLILAVISIILTLGLYLIDPTWLSSGWLSFFSFVLSIYFMVAAVRQFKNMNGGYASFGEALIQAFGTAFLSIILASIFQWLLYNVIDPGLGDVIKESVIAKMEDLESLMGEEATEKMIEGIEDQDFSMGIGQMAQGIGIASIFNLVISLIVSAFTKKNREGLNV